MKNNMKGKSELNHNARSYGCWCKSLQMRTKRGSSYLTQTGADPRIHYHNQTERHNQVLWPFLYCSGTYKQQENRCVSVLGISQQGKLFWSHYTVVFPPSQMLLIFFNIHPWAETFLSLTLECSFIAGCCTTILHHSDHISWLGAVPVVWQTQCFKIWSVLHKS